MTERMGLEVDTLTIRIPIRLQRRGGRKLIMTPEGVAMSTPKPRRDDTLIKALVRAHRWRRRIESGQVKSITDLAEQEGVTDAYVCRLLPLTCLAPEIVEAILDGRQPKGLRVAEVLVAAWRADIAEPERQHSARSSYPRLARLVDARLVKDCRGLSRGAYCRLTTLYPGAASRPIAREHGHGIDPRQAGRRYPARHRLGRLHLRPRR
jgi:hypothetical protein